MSIDHGRRAVLGAAVGATLATAPAAAQPASSRRPPHPGVGIVGLRPDADDDQTATLRRALTGAARERAGVHLPPGRFRIAGLTLPPGSRLIGAGVGATVLVQAGAEPILTARDGEGISVHDMTLEGHPTATGATPLIAFVDVAGLHIADLAVSRAGGTAMRLERCGGRIERCAISDADIGLFSLDATGLQVVGNVVDRCRNNGIQIWRSQKGYDGTQVLANRVARIAAEAGGSGQNGNGINIFRAGGVIVAQNIVRDCAFSAVRNNAGDDVQILGNSCTDLGEVAIYAEFTFEGCIISNNLVDRANVGVSITNFNEGGRLAVVSGNIVRNLSRRFNPAKGAYDGGIGIAVEADSSVTGNVIEGAEVAGIAIGYGAYQRDVLCSGNVVRRCGYGVSVSVAAGSGPAQIAGNILSECSLGRVGGFDHDKVVTGDLAERMDGRFGHLAVHGNTGR
jgi:uncharacterized secreted repeat protein (TIGR03808 family)